MLLNYSMLAVGAKTVIPQDQTDMGGAKEAFLTTHWSLIEGIKKSQNKDRLLISILLERYWKPVYCYLRSKGYKNEEAKDLTQSFFHEVVLNRHLVERADSSKGRFRSFILHALGQFLISQKRKETAKKQIPKEKLVPLDINDPPVLPQDIIKGSPEECFLYAWKSILVDKTLSQVQAECKDRDLEIHWNIFRDKIVQPLVDGKRPPSNKDLSNLYGIEDEATVSNMLVTVKRRFKAALKKQLRATVLSDDDITPELQEILNFFGKGAQEFT
jgi:DNA-directed RNA polymerase specialized sigma24 family protein